MMMRRGNWIPLTATFDDLLTINGTFCGCFLDMCSISWGQMAIVIKSTAAIVICILIENLLSIARCAENHRDLTIFLLLYYNHVLEAPRLLLAEMMTDAWQFKRALHTGLLTTFFPLQDDHDEDERRRRSILFLKLFCTHASKLKDNMQHMPKKAIIRQYTTYYTLNLHDAHKFKKFAWLSNFLHITYIGIGKKFGQHNCAKAQFLHNSLASLSIACGLVDD